jgi:hypothetical protein
MHHVLQRLFLCLVLVGPVACNDSATTGPATANIALDVVGTGLDGDAFVCGPQECMIETICYAHMDRSEGNDCLACDITQQRSEWSMLTAVACDDNSLCTQQDTCDQGQCLGAQKDCNDSQACTVDTCIAETGECSYEDSDGLCDDGNACTLEDTCSERECVSGALDDCDDGEPCTVDACSPGTGCAHQGLDVGSCDDGDSCTLDESCIVGVCTPEDALNCNDDDICTADACDPLVGCVHTPYSDVCDDGDSCTTDVCNSDTGCSHDVYEGPCDDNDACSENDLCTAGLCAGQPVVIDDGDPCTDDTCDVKDGISHVFNVAPCEDGDACTAGDTCLDGQCMTGPASTDCDDASICTTDSCEPDTGCVYVNALDCDDGNACTQDLCDAVSGCASAVIENDNCRPQIVVSTPARGATLLGSPDKQFVTVAGSVSSNAGDITELLLNGIPIGVGEEGLFSATIPAFVGGNTIVLETMDTMGTSRKAVQSFHWSPQYFKATEDDPDGAIADPGAAIFLAPAINDKLEDIFEVVLADFDIAQFIPSPVTPEPVSGDAGLGTVSYMIYLGNCPEENCCVGDKCYDFFEYDVPTVEITLVDGGLAVEAVISNISSGIWGTRTDCSWLGCLAPSPLVGTMSLENITIQATLKLSANEDHELVVEAVDTSATFGGVTVNIDHWTAFLIEGIINDQIGGLLSDVEKEFSEQLDDILVPLISDALSALAFEADFPLPPLFPGGTGATLNLTTDFADVESGPDGMLFILRAASSLIEAPEGEGDLTPWNTDEHLGAVGRATCATEEPIVIPTSKTSPLELVLADDTMNLLLHAAWEGGFLEFDIPAEQLGDVDLAQYGVEDLTVKLSGMLPPVLSDCSLDELRLHIGDLRIDAQMTALGSPVDVVMYLSLTAGFAFNVSDAGLSFGLTDLEAFDFEVTVQQPDLIAFEPIVEELIANTLMPQLLGNLTTGACLPTEAGCEPACSDGAACTLESLCECDTGTLLDGEACVQDDTVCDLECKGAGVCVTEGESETCICGIGLAGTSCHDCAPGFSSVGGLAAFPLPVLDLSGDDALQGVPPIEIIPFESDHIDGFTIISGDLL